MIPKQITKAWLLNKEACQDQVKVFSKEWPNGAALTRKNLLRAVELGLDLIWLANEVLPPQLWKAYREGVAQLQKDYEEGVAKLGYAEAQLWKAYLKAYREGVAKLLADKIEGGDGQKEAVMRYVINPRTSKIHDQRNLKERCNTDDILDETKELVGLIEMQELIRKAGYDLCEWCFNEEETE